MPGRAHTVGRWAARAAWVALALVASVAFGVTTARATGSLGPHQAQFAVTTDATLTLDLGPLGTLQIDSPLPATLGVRAVVQEIPQTVTEVDQASTLAALSRDLNSYVQLFSGTQAAIADVAADLIRDAAVRAAVTFVLVLVAWFGGRALLGSVRRGELAARVRPYRRRLVAGGTALVIGGTVLTGSLGPAQQPQNVTRRASAVFDGTPLAGARITGRLGGIVDTYGGLVVDAYRDNEEFYDGARDSLDVAWASWAERDADGEGGPTLGLEEDEGSVPAAETGSGAQQAAGPEAVLESGDPGASPTPERTSSPSPQPSAAVEPVVFVLVSDLHCNVGMARVVGRLAELAGADAVLDAGDTTMNGTSVEEQCITTLTRAVPDGIRMVVSPGNHDSATTSAAYARAGATVLDGQAVDVDGIRVLGDHDPNETRVGAGTTAGRETVTQMGERLATTACDDGNVDLLLIHNPAVGVPALESGCVPAQVSGHYHRRTDPVQVGLGIRYISSSTAGAVLGQPTIGPLNGTAELTVLRLDPTTGRLLSWQLVQVGKDGVAQVGDAQAWPAIVEPQDEADDEAAGDLTSPESSGTPSPDEPQPTP